MKVEGAVCVWLDHVTASNNPSKKKHVNYSGSSALELFLCCNDKKLKFDEIPSENQHFNLFSNGQKVYGYALHKNTENALKIFASRCAFDETISFEKAVSNVIKGIESFEQVSQKRLKESEYFLTNTKEVMSYL